MKRICSAAYGNHVALSINGDDEVGVRALLPHWWADCDDDPDAEWQVDSAASARFVIRELELWVGEHSRDHVFLHAAVVSLGGLGVLLPGRSFSGKTVLTAALLRAGASYGSDEYAVLRPDGLVEPYPRPLALRDDSEGRIERSFVGAQDFGAPTLTDPVRLALVVFARYEAGTQTRLGAMSPGDGVLALLDNALAAQHRPRFVLDTILTVTAHTRWVDGTRGPADAAAADVVALTASLRGNED